MSKANDKLLYPIFKTPLLYASKVKEEKNNIEQQHQKFKTKSVFMDLCVSPYHPSFFNRQNRKILFQFLASSNKRDEIHVYSLLKMYLSLVLEDK